MEIIKLIALTSIFLALYGANSSVGLAAKCEMSSMSNEDRQAKAVRVNLVHKYSECSKWGQRNAKDVNLETLFKAVLEEITKTEGNRVAYLTQKSVGVSEEETPVESGQTLGTGNYVMKVGLGTPSKELELVIDTGSDLAWTQCKPCSGTSSAGCYTQQDPIFDPAASKTYKAIACGTTLCHALDISGCSSGKKGTCQYGIQYLDGSFTIGELGTDTLSVDGRAVSSAFVFGCGHDNEGLFQGFDGLIGLSKNAPFSFIEQTAGVFHQSFSYCLPPPFSAAAGFIQFGGSAGDPPAATPLVANPSIKTYIVGMTTVRVASGAAISAAGSASLIVDSGTVISRIDSPLYTKIRDAFTKAAVAAPYSYKPAPADAGEGLFDACYVFAGGKAPAAVPSLTIELGGGVSFTPKSDGILYPVDLQSGTYCFAFAPIQSDSGLSILGNYQQQGFLFSFDVIKATLAIKPNAC